MKVEVKQNIIHALISGSLFISLVIMLLSAHEYYVVDIKKDIADYHFGNEHSMEEGGSHYESATSYSQSMLFKTMTYLLIAVVLCFGIVRRRLGFFVIAGVIFASTFLLSGCSEQKTDDPKKAFELWTGRKPDNSVKVINGQYWQSAHGSKEYILYLEVQASTAWQEEFSKQNNLTLSEARDYPNDAPAWFKPSDNYRVWKASAFDQGSRYFEDTLSGHMYLYEIQL